MRFNNVIKKPYIYLPLLTGIILLLFLLFHPKVSSKLFFQRAETSNTLLLNKIKNKEFISGQYYWEFREFYSPGHYIFDRTGIKSSQLDTDLNTIMQTVTKEKPILYFSSPKLSSIDVLINDSTLPKSLPGYKEIHRTDTNVVFEKANRKVYILLFNNNELQKSNGFLDYQGIDKEFTKNKSWVSLAVIK